MTNPQENLTRMGFGDRLAIVVIDVTRGNVEERWTKDPHVRNILEPVARLLAAARGKRIPVFYTTGGLFSQTARAARITDSERGSWIWKVPLNDRRGTTWEALEESMQIPARIAPGPGDVVIRKIKPSGFFESPLQSHLTGRGIDTLIICGTATNSGVLHTVCEAFSCNYRAIVPRECCATKDPEFHEVAFEMMNRIQADVMDLQAVLEEIGKRPAQPPAPAARGEKPAVLVMGGADIAEGSAAANSTARLLAAARAKGVPVVHAVEPAGNAQAPGAFVPGKGEPVIMQCKPSSFCETPLRGFLTYYRADTIIVCGSARDLGLLHTVNDAHCAGYRVIVPRECVDGRASRWHEVSLEMIARQSGGVVGLKDALALLDSLPGGPA